MRRLHTVDGFVILIIKRNKRGINKNRLLTKICAEQTDFCFPFYAFYLCSNIK